jgi:hypothetical protein
VQADVRPHACLVACDTGPHTARGRAATGREKTMGRVRDSGV